MDAEGGLGDWGGGGGGYSRVQSEAVAAGVVSPKVVVLRSHAGTVNAVVVAVRELVLMAGSRRRTSSFLRVAVLDGRGHLIEREKERVCVRERGGDRARARARGVS